MPGDGVEIAQLENMGRRPIDERGNKEEQRWARKASDTRIRDLTRNNRLAAWTNANNFLEQRLNQYMQKTAMTGEDAANLIELKRKALEGDEVALNTLEEQGVINGDERMAIWNSITKNDIHAFRSLAAENDEKNRSGVAGGQSTYNDSGEPTGRRRRKALDKSLIQTLRNAEWGNPKAKEVLDSIDGYAPDTNFYEAERRRQKRLVDPSTTFGDGMKRRRGRPPDPRPNMRRRPGGADNPATPAGQAGGGSGAGVGRRVGERVAAMMNKDPSYGGDLGAKMGWQVGTEAGNMNPGSPAAAGADAAAWNVAAWVALRLGASPAEANAIGGEAQKAVSRDIAAATADSRARQVEADIERASARGAIRGKKAALMKMADNEARINRAKRRGSDRALAKKARQNENRRITEEWQLKVDETAGVQPTAELAEQIESTEDARNTAIVQAKAANYLDMDRTAEKLALADDAKNGSVPAARMLKTIVWREQIAKRAVGGDPRAIDTFAGIMAADPAVNKRALVPAESVADSQVLGAVGQQVLASKKKRQRRRAKANADLLQEIDHERNAERRAADQIVRTGDTANASKILKQQQRLEDLAKAKEFGENAAHKAFVNGATPEEVEKVRARAEMFANLKLTAMSRGVPNDAAALAAQKIVDRAMPTAPEDPEEEEISEPGLKRIAKVYNSAFNQARRRGLSPVAANAVARQQALEVADGERSAEAARRRSKAAQVKAARAADAAGKAMGEVNAAVAANAQAEIQANAAERRARHAAKSVADTEKRDRALAKELERENMGDSPDQSKITAANFMRQAESDERRREFRRKLQNDLQDSAKKLRKGKEGGAAGEGGNKTMLPQDAAAQAVDAQKARAQEGEAAAKLRQKIVKAQVNAAKNMIQSNRPYAEAVAEAQQTGKEMAQKVAQDLGELTQENKKQLKNVPADRQEALAKHLALVEAGGVELGAASKEDEQAEDTKRKMEKMLRRAKMAIRKAIPDTKKSVKLQNVDFNLHQQNGGSFAPANNGKDAQIKEGLRKLNHAVRNTITDGDVGGNLLKFRGKEGVYNAPESSKSLVVWDGLVYMTAEAYEKAKQEGKNVDAYEAHFTTEKDKPFVGANGLYYMARAKGKTMSLVGHPLEKKLRGEGQEINAEDAESIHIVEGEVQMMPVKNYLAKLHESVPDEPYKSQAEEIAQQIKALQRMLEQDRENASLNQATVTMLEGIDGDKIVEITTPSGKKRKMPVKEAIAMFRAERETADKMARGAEANGVAQEVEEGSVLEEYMTEARKAAMTMPADVLNPNNPMRNNAVNAIVAAAKGGDEVQPLARRDGDTPEVKMYNAVARDAKEIAAKAGIDLEKFNSRIKALPPNTWTSYLQFYESIAGNIRANQIIAEMDSQPFYKNLRESFTELEVSKLYHLFAPAAEEVTHHPDMTTAMVVSTESTVPVTESPIGTNPMAPVVKEVVSSTPIETPAELVNPPLPPSPQQQAAAAAGGAQGAAQPSRDLNDVTNFYKIDTLPAQDAADVQNRARQADLQAQPGSWPNFGAPAGANGGFRNWLQGWFPQQGESSGGPGTQPGPAGQGQAPRQSVRPNNTQPSAGIDSQLGMSNNYFVERPGQAINPWGIGGAQSYPVPVM